jgi:hypothetical protein
LISRSLLVPKTAATTLLNNAVSLDGGSFGRD